MNGAQPMALVRADPGHVREAHRRFPTGVTVVTALSDGRPYGLSVNAFASVTLEPPTVLVCISRTARSYGPLVRAEVVGINLLSEGQADVARIFASRSEDKFATVAWRPGPAGAPLLDHGSACFEIAVQNLVLATTHAVLIGEVMTCAHSERPPLLYLAGGFHACPSGIDSLNKEPAVT